MSNVQRKSGKAGESVLTAYFEDINRIPLLSREEEDSLARRARRGDPIARQKLIQANLRFVVRVAKGFQMLGMPLEDLVGEGNIGLMKAVERFDPARGYRFISYAVWWIRQSIMRAIGEKTRLIRLPQSMTAELLRVVKEREDLPAGCSADQEAELIARRLNSSREHVAQLLNISREALSLDAGVGAEDDVSALEDFVVDTETRHPEDLAIESLLRDDINRALETLSRRESEVIQSRFGLNGKRPMTLKAIGGVSRLTKERVRQIEKKAISRLRRPPLLRLLRAYC